jgi:aquaporin NIP
VSEGSGRVPAAARRPPGPLAAAAIAEAVGTYMLVFFGTGTVVAFLTPLGREPPLSLDALAVALAFGFAVVLAVYAFGHVSGNPHQPGRDARARGRAEVRLVGRPRLPRRPVRGGDPGVAYTLGALRRRRPEGARPPQGDATGSRGTGLALLAEVVITFALVVVILATATDGRGPGPVAAGLAIGLTVAAGILVTLPISGGSFNLARTFGPMIVSAEFPGWWAYIVGPIAGGLAGAALYDFVLRRGAPPGAGRI